MNILTVGLLVGSVGLIVGDLDGRGVTFLPHPSGFQFPPSGCPHGLSPPQLDPPHGLGLLPALAPQLGPAFQLGFEFQLGPEFQLGFEFQPGLFRLSGDGGLGDGGSGELGGPPGDHLLLISGLPDGFNVTFLLGESVVGTGTVGGY